MQVIVDGLLVHYDQYGDEHSPLLVIVHGWADSAASWKPVAKVLARDYRVMVPNLPGFGGSQNPSTVWGLDDYAACLAAFLRKLDAKPYALVGHSNGGAIAIRGLATAQLQAEKLVLLGSAGIRATQQGRKLVLKLLAKTGKVITWPLPQTVKKRLRGNFYQQIGSELLVAEHLQDTFKQVVGQDVQADAATLQLQTLLIYGEQDMSTPVVYGEQLHQLIAGSQLEVITEAGHFVHHDAEPTVVTLMREFLL